MNRLKDLYEITLQLKDLLDQKITSQNRQEVISHINELVEKRGAYLTQVTPPYTEQEKELGEKLVPLNEAIQDQMQQLFDELKNEMKQVKKQKKSNQSYTNPYKSVQTMDGLFLDRKN